MWIIDHRPLKCGKCGSTNFETFQRPTVHGTRCLSCGHEATEDPPHIKAQKQAEMMRDLQSWNREIKDRTF